MGVEFFNNNTFLITNKNIRCCDNESRNAESLQGEDDASYAVPPPLKKQKGSPSDSSSKASSKPLAVYDTQVGTDITASLKKRKHSPSTERKKLYEKIRRGKASIEDEARWFEISGRDANSVPRKPQTKEGLQLYSRLKNGTASREDKERWFEITGQDASIVENMSPEGKNKNRKGFSMHNEATRTRIRRGMADEDKQSYSELTGKDASAVFLQDNSAAVAPSPPSSQTVQGTWQFVPHNAPPPTLYYPVPTPRSFYLPPTTSTPHYAPPSAHAKYLYRNQYAHSKAVQNHAHTETANGNGKQMDHGLARKNTSTLPHGSAPEGKNELFWNQIRHAGNSSFAEEQNAEKEAIVNSSNIPETRSGEYPRYEDDSASTAVVSKSVAATAGMHPRFSEYRSLRLFILMERGNRDEICAKHGLDPVGLREADFDIPETPNLSMEESIKQLQFELEDIKRANRNLLKSIRSEG